LSQKLDYVSCWCAAFTGLA